MADRSIRNVRVRRTRSRYSTYTYKQHHGISTDLFGIKWGIGIYKAKRTLKYITQDNLRSALKPLTRRYITYLMLQRLRRLKFRFNTYTLFAKDKSIVWNICDQIFIDEEFFQITPMRYKS